MFPLKNQCYFFDLTVSAATCEKETLLTFLKDNAKQWAFQLEKGETTGYEHYQCRMNLKQKTRDPRDMHPGHWTPTQTETTQNKRAFSYVMKAETRVSGPWTDKDNTFIPDHVKAMKTLYPWQETVLEALRMQNNRQILWIWDSEGNVGKSAFLDYLQCYEKAHYVPPFCSNESQIAGYVYKAVVNDPGRKHWFVFDLPRSVDSKQLKQICSIIELTKDGRAFEARNHSRNTLFNRPTILVASNEEPPRKWQSKDRWNIMKIEL